MNHTDSNHADSTTIGPKNQHDSEKCILLHKMISWDSHDSQAIRFHTTTPQAHNNVSELHAQSMLTLPCNFAYRTS